MKRVLTAHYHLEIFNLRLIILVFHLVLSDTFLPKLNSMVIGNPYKIFSKAYNSCSLAWNLLFCICDWILRKTTCIIYNMVWLQTQFDSVFFFPVLILFNLIVHFFNCFFFLIKTIHYQIMKLKILENS